MDLRYICHQIEIPRIYTSIAVKAGSKNDPQHASGIAHYLEHMMFKGNPTDRHIRF